MFHGEQSYEMIYNNNRRVNNNNNNNNSSNNSSNTKRQTRLISVMIFGVCVGWILCISFFLPLLFYWTEEVVVATENTLPIQRRRTKQKTAKDSYGNNNNEEEEEEEEEETMMLMNNTSSSSIGRFSLRRLRKRITVSSKRPDISRISTDIDSNKVEVGDVCLFTASTLDRLNSVLPRLKQSWRGTISCAVLATENEVREQIYLSKKYANGDDEFDSFMERMTIIAVDPLKEYESRFPVNALRNLAFSGCRKYQKAKFVVLHDVDFEIFEAPAPSKDLLGEIENVLKPKMKRALVIPAFTADDRYLQRVEKYRQHNNFSRASLKALNSFNRKETLVHMIRVSHIVESFRERYWPVAHATTNVSKWIEYSKKKNETNSSNVDDDDVVGPYGVGANFNNGSSRHPYYYEPWIIMRASDEDELVSFDESFVTYGFNKISFIHELAANGFQLFVSLSSWMVHTNVHQSRGSASSAEMVEKCKNTAISGKDYRISRIGHSCIPRFLHRLECAYNFGIANVKWPTYKEKLDDSIPEQYLLSTMKDESKIACFGGCVTDLEQVPKTPAIAIFQGKNGTVFHRVGEKPARRRRGACEALKPSSEAVWSL
jgi:hypothetical protein